MKPTVRNGVLTYTHQAVIDEILANPLIERKELADKFGVSENWMKKVINSDAFQTVLDKRREQIVNPIISQTVQERLRGVTNSAIDLLQTRLDAGHVKNEEAIEIAKMGLETQGLLGNAKAVAGNNQFVIMMPPPQATTEAWVEQAKEEGISDAEIIEVSAGGKG